MQQAVYLDYNATAPLRPEAAAAMAEAYGMTGNASSVHGFGRSVRRLIETAREGVAGLVGAVPAQIVFTSGGTESNNLALLGTGRSRLLVSAGEHDSVLQVAPDAEILPLHADGRVDLAVLEEKLASRSQPTLLSVMLANNETGVIQPIAEVAEIAHRHGALMHCDAVQAAGKIPVAMPELAADLMSLSAHKLGGPTGVGALVIGDGVDLRALLKGGGQERGYRAGTESISGITGFGAAAVAARDAVGEGARLGALRDGMERRLAEIAPEVAIFGSKAPRLPNTSCFALPGMPAETQVMALDLAGVAVSAGSACSSGKVGPSHVLQAMGAGDKASCAIRVSLGWRSEAAHLERFLDAWRALYSRCAQAAPVAKPAA